MQDLGSFDHGPQEPAQGREERFSRGGLQLLQPRVPTCQDRDNNTFTTRLASEREDQWSSTWSFKKTG